MTGDYFTSVYNFLGWKAIFSESKSTFHLCPHHWRSFSGRGSVFQWRRRSPYPSLGSGFSCACTAAETSRWKLFAHSRWAHSSSSELKFSPAATNQQHIAIVRKHEFPDFGGKSLHHLLPSELHLDIRINQVLIFSYEGLFDVGHNAGVHPGETLGSVDLQVVTSPLSLCRHALWQQEVPGKDVSGRISNGQWWQQLGRSFTMTIYKLPLYFIFICFIRLVWSLYSVSFGHNCNVTLHVAFTSRWDVVRIRQQSPLVVKLMIWKTNKHT